VSNGSVVLRGIEIDLVTDIGEGFVLDCARYCEGLLTEEQVKKKYELSSNAWSRLSENEPLQRAVERAKERRIRNGDAAREKAQHLFITAPDILGGILNNTLTSPRHRIEAAKELRQVALGGAENTPGMGDRVVVVIDLGEDEKLVINKPLACGPDDPNDPNEQTEESNNEPVRQIRKE
jgi:hypothetical protein